MGALRLTRSGFRVMPRQIAIAIVAIGVAVIAFGAVLPLLANRSVARAPRIALRPAPSAVVPTAKGVHGLVRTASGRAAPDVAVVLRPAFGGGHTLRSRTGGDGRFTFDDVAVSPGEPYVAEATYGGAKFASGVLRVSTPRTHPVRITVAPTTRSARRVSVELESIAVVGDDRGLQAVHALKVRNRGERAYAGPLRLSLLPGATAIDPRTGLNRRALTLRNGELVSRAPLLPGLTDIAYTYVAPTGRRPFDARPRVRYPTERFELLVGGRLAVDGDPRPPLRRASGIKLGGRSYARLIATDLEPSRTLDVRLGPARSFWGRAQPAAIATAMVIAVAIVAYPLVRRRQPRRAVAATMLEPT